MSPCIRSCIRPKYWHPTMPIGHQSNPAYIPILPRMSVPQTRWAKRILPTLANGQSLARSLLGAKRPANQWYCGCFHCSRLLNGNLPTSSASCHGRPCLPTCAPTKTDWRCRNRCRLRNLPCWPLHNNRHCPGSNCNPTMVP